MVSLCRRSPCIRLAAVTSVGLDPARYGTHAIRRTRATLIYKRTKNIRAIQLLLGHTKLETTVRYLGIEVDDALEISEQTGIRRHKQPFRRAGSIRAV